MSTPVYQLFVGKHSVATLQAQRALPKAKRDELMGKQMESAQRVGATGLVFCDSYWADEEHPWWGVTRFPSIEARMEHARDLQKLEWDSVVEAFTLMGTSETEPPAVTIPNPIYKLWVLRSNPAGAAAQAGMSQLMGRMAFEKHDALYKENKSLALLNCNSYWCNEAYTNFGVSVYPNVEANMRVQQGLADLGWQSYVDSFTILGTPTVPEL